MGRRKGFGSGGGSFSLHSALDLAIWGFVCENLWEHGASFIHSASTHSRDCSFAAPAALCCSLGPVTALTHSRCIPFSFGSSLATFGVGAPCLCFDGIDGGVVRSAFSNVCAPDTVLPSLLSLEFPGYGGVYELENHSDSTQHLDSKALVFRG